MEFFWEIEDLLLDSFDWADEDSSVIKNIFLHYWIHNLGGNP